MILELIYSEPLIIVDLAQIAPSPLAHHFFELLLPFTYNRFIRFVLTHLKPIRGIQVGQLLMGNYPDGGVGFVSGTATLDEQRVRGLVSAAVVMGEGLDGLNICDEVFYGHLESGLLVIKSVRSMGGGQVATEVLALRDDSFLRAWRSTKG